jgi:hypothetical protein
MFNANCLPFIVVVLYLTCYDLFAVASPYQNEIIEKVWLYLLGFRICS